MKRFKAITAIILFWVGVSTAGCTKCAQCTTTVTQHVIGQQPIISSATSELCGSDLKEADGNVTHSTATVQGYTANVKSETKCR